MPNQKERFGKRRPQGRLAMAAGERRGTAAFPALTANLPRGNPVYSAANGCQYPAAQAQLYAELREAVPIIDAAVMRLVRLLGGFRLQCEDPAAQERLRETLEMIPVGGTRFGVANFISSYFEQLLTYGCALGELILREDGQPAALWNAPLEGITLRRAKNGLDVEICTGESDRLKPAPWPELICYSVLNPSPGELTGHSILQGLPFVSHVLLQILNTLGQNWERMGNVRFAVTYHPGSGSEEQAHAGERTQLLAKEWENAMREGAGVRDFIAAGDVRIQTIGADAPLPNSEIPVRQLLEQIVAKTGLPPFLLGLTWSSTERMSSVQADLLTSEIESYRRVLTPVILRVARMMLRLWGEDARCAVEWDDITLADEVELARAALLRSQAAR
ncbi:MAG: serine/threonine protein phosphatase [Oscillospiraceae bacterium]|jgi:hypothetical protein|nr:serine/threonine protein phosphatase [Oscillospiraceae bacterium]